MLKDSVTWINIQYKWSQKCLDVKQNEKVKTAPKTFMMQLQWNSVYPNFDLILSVPRALPKGKSNIVWWPNTFPFCHHVWSCWIVIVAHKDTRSNTLSNIEYLWYCLVTHCTTFDYIWLPTFSHLETSGRERFSLFSSGGLQPLGRLLPKILFHSSALFLPCYTELNCSQSFNTSSLVIMTFEGQSSHTL